jgi:hypothetical protein
MPGFYHGHTNNGTRRWGVIGEARGFSLHELERFDAKAGRIAVISTQTSDEAVTRSQARQPYQDDDPTMLYFEMSDVALSDRVKENGAPLPESVNLTPRDHEVLSQISHLGYVTLNQTPEVSLAS